MGKFDELIVVAIAALLCAGSFVAGRQTPPKVPAKIPAFSVEEKQLGELVLIRKALEAPVPIYSKLPGIVRPGVK